MQQSNTVTLPRLMTEQQLCELVYKSEKWAQRARWQGDGPRYVKLGRHVRYRAEDVEEWINSNLRESTTEAKK